MPIVYLKTVARLEGECGVEEAEGLFEWLHENPRGKINLKACEHLHSAIIQVLMALRPCVSACPPAASPVAAILAAICSDDCD